MTHAFDLPAFRVSFPLLAAVQDDQLAAYWQMATETMTPEDGILLSGASLQLALNLLTAHLAWLFTKAPAGITGVVNSASEGSVSVGMAVPPFKSGWQYWLSQTPYGQQLWALLMVQSAGGLYVGGSMERAAFRKAGGVF
ncbi:MAG: DUF4054 domain-containing protein [Betaproteobacteria bacterium]|nr:DUF4054 domain-containing protein [Betaproteobacteria bacterium]